MYGLQNILSEAGYEWIPEPQIYKANKPILAKPLDLAVRVGTKCLVLEAKLVRGEGVGIGEAQIDAIYESGMYF